ncbi:hypothetical protein [Chryseobacterium sp. SG20098]|uniref:hypothetical protein n=1 Tax=Chryseobacterium sp. SG20098 TaxID=3074145 RepID=UPI0028831572|nr:hypothetical protein [Chryseobacterium sp. SG20098]WNI36200.1 hypothetical protein RHP76_19900 [Chryseobacterium sp. SG20098]
MKKINLSAFLLAAFLGNFNILKAQDGIAYKYMNLFKPTPEVAKLISHVDFPVGQTSGSLDLKIPLYTIKTKSLDVPINLFYKNPGFQVNEESSNIGLGWDLDVGGRIYRQVRGQVDNQSGFRAWRQSDPKILFPECPDITYDFLDAFEACNLDYKYMFGIFGSPRITYQFDGNYYNYMGMGIPLPQTPQGGWPFMNANTIVQDAESEADIFYYRYPKGSGKFFYGDQFQIKSIPFTKEKITENTITDTEGNVFYFNDKADVIDVSKTNMTKYFSANNYAPAGLQNWNYSYSFLLSKIVTKTNDVINFTYSDVEYTKYGPTVWKFRKNVNSLPSFGNVSSKPITDAYFDNKEMTYQRIKTKKIESISVNNKVVARFIYSDVPRKDLFYETNFSPKALVKIQILDDAGNTVNTINFHQSYFGQNSSAQSTIQETSKYYRLKLDSFENNDAKYQFNYFNADNDILPDKSIGDSKDHWGFYNGKQAHYTHSMASSQILEEISDTYKYPDLDKTKITVLKDVIYPTGGKESYEYELNNVNSANVGGLRIASIIKNDNTGIIKKRITYDHGYLYTEPQYANYEIVNSYTVQAPFLPNLFLYNFNVYSSTSINDLLGFNGYPVYYSKITEENLNVLNQNLGKTVTEYSYYEDIIGNTGYTPSYYMTNVSYDWKRNLPIKVSYYRANETSPYKKISNHYTFLDTAFDLADVIYPGPGGGFPTLLKPNESQYTSYKIYIRRLQTDVQNITPIWMGGIQANAMSAQFDFSFSRLISAQYFKDKETVEETIDGNILTTTTDFKYDNPANAQLTSETTTFPDNSIKETTYKYAHEKNNQKLINANMVSIPLETVSVKKQNVNDTTGKIISKIETRYDDPTTLFPTSVISTGLQGTASTEVTYDKYDNKGNIQQYTTKDGISTVIIWGYNQTQPIAKIEGAKLSDIQQSFIDSIINASNTDASAAANNDETSFLSVLNTFRNSLPNYQITTYTYDPLIGVRSITPPSGIRESYVYDSANRLQKVIDVNGKVLKEMKYNYKN